jgi:aflatoxin B1 aldehyde reductase
MFSSMIWYFLISCRLIPCLRHFGIKFYAYGPLTYISYDLHCLLDDLHFDRGGLLSGKILDEDSMKNAKGGRWDPSVSHMAPLLHEQCAPLLPILRELKELLVRKGDDCQPKRAYSNVSGCA